AIFIFPGSPIDYAFPPSRSDWTNTIVLLLEVADRFLEHLKKAFPLLERDPTMLAHLHTLWGFPFGRLTFGAGALKTEGIKKQFEGGHYLQITGRQFKRS
ncbi:hypothetical protein A2U01_0066873, partial [Trifolium medium]|nr:hypothetical protein [Trifolium medium]